MHLERGLQSSRKREKRGHLPRFISIPVGIQPFGAEGDNKRFANK